MGFMRDFVINELKQKEIVKQGDFVLKSGKRSNIYVNLKNLVSYPGLMSSIGVMLSNMIRSEHDITQNTIPDIVLCGVPYGGIPIATTVSLIMNVEQVLLRKQQKSYGLKQLVEGNPRSNDVILIEDVVTSGSSVLEACEALESQGYRIVKVYSVVYRGEEITSTLFKSGIIDARIGDYPYSYLFHIDELRSGVMDTVRGHGPYSDSGVENTIIHRQVSFKEYDDNSLMQYCSTKHTNIIVAFDKEGPMAKYDLLYFIDKVYPYIVGLKIHSEALGLTMTDNKQLYEQCKRLGIFLWEDRKFNDTANTFSKQVKKYEKVRDYISVVPTSGVDILKVSTTLKKLVLCEMSSDNNTFNTTVTRQILEFMEEPEVRMNVAGIICQSEELFGLDIPTIMPGVNLDRKTDGKGQVWRDPRTFDKRPTLYVIGRAITEAKYPGLAAKRYANALYV